MMATAEQTVRAVLEATNKAYIVEQGETPVSGDALAGPIFYRRWSNGFIEQWQMITTGDKTITLPIAFTRTDYAVIGAGFGIGGVGEQFIENKTTSSFRCVSGAATCRTNGWYACGY